MTYYLNSHFLLYMFDKRSFIILKIHYESIFLIKFIHILNLFSLKFIATWIIQIW